MLNQTALLEEMNARDAANRDRFTSLTSAHFQDLKKIVGEDYVRTDEETLEAFSHDWTEDLRFAPAVVVKPATTAELSQLLAYCNERLIPVTPAGGRTGLSGGMLPVFGGVALSMERFNQILEIDTRNLQVRTQSGVITQELQEAVAEQGLMYPPDPSSKGSCFIGGNLAENAGGAHAVKYGITKDYVLNLEVVLANGEVIQTGADVLKNSTGYNLTQLMVGSEGTLGVITEATLKLIPPTTQDLTLLVPFQDPEKACEAVSAIFHTGITPAALEFMEVDAINYAQNYLDVYPYNLEGVGAHLLIKLDGNDMEALMQECEQLLPVLEDYGGQEVLFAETAQQKEELWRLRRCIGEAVKSGKNIYKEEDTVVPRAELAKLLKFVKELGRKYEFQSVCYGHAGDGNLHVNILRNDMPLEKWENELPNAITELFEYVKDLRGTLSGEHGIGWVQRRYMPVTFNETQLNLMKGIKQTFDPNGILNPGKVFP